MARIKPSLSVINNILVLVETGKVTAKHVFLLQDTYGEDG
jgi:hypothetical protein